MTGTRGRQHVVVSAVPRTFRVSVFGGRTQLDIELPADVPIANIVPELAALVSSRDIKREDTPDDALENKRDRWVLTRIETDTAIDSAQTLEAAGSRDGDLLKLTTERALNPPELFDDVVDAVARLNREGFATWGTRAARWMAFAGLAVAVAIIDLLLLRNDDLTARTLLGYQTVGVIAALVIAAVVAQRFYSEHAVAAALGLAALPLVYGVTSVFTEHLPDSWQRWSFVIICVLMVGMASLGWRIIHAGRIGFVSVAVAFGIFVVGSVAQAAFEWPAHIIGPILAAAGLLLALCADPLARLLRSRSVYAEHDSGEEPAPEKPDLFANPFDRAAPHEQRRRAADRASARVPSAEDVAEAVERFRSIRLALYAASAIVVITGTAIAAGADSVSWSVVAFNTVVAIAMALRSARQLPFGASSVLLVAGVAVMVLTSVALRSAPTAMFQAAGLATLLIALAALAAGIAVSPKPSATVSRTFDYLEYLAVLAVLPVMAWAIGLYGMIGTR